ncbi:hypothetical protein HWQ46_21670 [Shewanella sp. D64]|uniref:hypothetical protein n=1 Tax=unclassified Shewanella TaxID=196818 RepID=UPI0022BA40AB|nr:MULTISPECIES: hypothetical protein [unclassified Shewanella]MEC4728149.1 hypothetical protein [Shewanella sp. D64]MEC4740269.1 hypothetical protein [Shewanella sp. E94]WBJ94414.1 hypothetical protein HWQ47_21480 [Shewanella sp. MTB7]
MNQPTFVIQFDLPAIPIEEYARRSGQGLDRCRQQVKEGKLPVLQEKAKGKIYVNLVAMAMTCQEAAQWNMKVPSAQYSL